MASSAYATLYPTDHGFDQKRSGATNEPLIQPIDIESSAAGLESVEPSPCPSPRFRFGTVGFCSGSCCGLSLAAVAAALLVTTLALVATAFQDITGGGAASSWHPLEPPLPGIMPGEHRPHIILAQDIDYPPYAYLGDATEEFDVDGFGHDVALRLQEVCEINVTVVETRWSNCWNSGEIGQGLLNGWFHGCMTYTHTVGQRNRFVEFSEPILQLNKPAGIIVRLDAATGLPEVPSESTLEGLRVVDVVGWAPTADGLSFVANSCASESKFAGFSMVEPAYDTGNANDNALLTLLGGSADAVWIYADQAKNYRCADGVDSSGSWNCTMWTEGFGTQFAYIHTGLYDYAYGGTTLSIAKKGSGVNKILDPCIKAFKLTQSYYDVCSENDMVHSCYKNEHFPVDPDADVTPPYEMKAKDLATTCADGYCPCS